MRTLLSLRKNKGRKGKRKGRSKQTDARLTLCAVNASRPPAGKGREGGSERVTFERRKVIGRQMRMGRRERGRRTCGLVQKNDGRVRHQLHSDRHPLALATRHALGEGGREGGRDAG